MGGRLAIESTDVLCLLRLPRRWGGQGLAYFRRLAAMKPMIHGGHILSAQLVASGEIPLLVTAYNNNIETPEEERRAGGVEADSSGVRPGKRHRPGQAFAAAARSAAVHDSVLSRDGQEVLKGLNRVPASLAVDSPLNKFPYQIDRPGAGPR